MNIEEATRKILKNREAVSIYIDVARKDNVVFSKRLVKNDLSLFVSLGGNLNSVIDAMENDVSNQRFHLISLLDVCDTRNRAIDYKTGGDDGIVKEIGNGSQKAVNRLLRVISSDTSFMSFINQFRIPNIEIIFSSNIRRKVDETLEKNIIDMTKEDFNTAREFIVGDRAEEFIEYSEKMVLGTKK